MAEGLHADPEKVRAVRETPRLTDVKGVQRLVGMVNYLSKFYDHLSDDCEILRQLTHNENMWEWSNTHEKAFQQLKDKIASALVLEYEPGTETAEWKDKDPSSYHRHC